MPSGLLRVGEPRRGSFVSGRPQSASLWCEWGHTEVAAVPKHQWLPQSHLLMRLLLGCLILFLFSAF